MKRLIATALPAILLLSIGTHGTAAVGPSKCSASKFKATGKKASSLARCYAKAVSRGGLVDQGCLANAHDKLASSFSKAESTGHWCLAPNGDVNAIESKVDAFMNDIRDIVNSSAAGPSGCDSKKIQAAGKKGSGTLECQSKAVLQGIDVDAECLGKAEERFSRSVSHAETANDNCTHIGQTNALESAVNAFVDDATAELAPSWSCGSALYPTCGGTCPQGQTCYPFRALLGRVCECATTDVPCANSPAACSGLACPPGKVCSIGNPKIGQQLCAGCFSPSGAFLDASL